MRVSQLLAFCIFAISAINAASLLDSKVPAVVEARAAGNGGSRVQYNNALEKRKGGGGKGGGGGGGGKSGGGSTGGGGRSSPSSNSGGATKAGSGAPRAYGGGGFYGGGASVPYTAGKKSTRGISPGLLLFPAAALAIFPGLWLFSVWPYTLHPYTFLNQTIQNATTQGLNQTLPVTCLCQDYSVCGCDDNDDPQYLKDLVGNGSYAALNKTLVTVSDVNGTKTLVINGTLPNGTTASGGSDDSAASVLLPNLTGYWVMGAIFLYAFTFL